ncbi:hypothetical protein NIES593_18880 [Hydrococcus rivularis NIES-593]|uniref:PEP-CTERM sorting domain-containing protein n=1 Tax=Hydrococcus rivularis NIES-593 TaxID=1921803 RepID=A0A1U7HA40_9CYAN|nr:hypothetical protein [Hydrococcus rivularis]OKH20443.1 hypothetical protein NIES593_18880 [Hydrococcus rivularis NIES-593]
MRNRLKINQQLLLFFASIVTGSTVATLPGYAAIFSASQTYLKLDNFNQIPQDIGVFYEDFNSKTISDKGKGAVQAKLDVDSIFKAENSLVFAQSNIQSQVLGSGSDYLGDLKISSRFVGQFFIAADRQFSFDFTALLGLVNAIERGQDEAASTYADISILLIDSLNLKAFDSFNLFANLNTDLTEISDSDFFSLTPGNNFRLNQVSELPFLGGIQESYQVLVQGSFQRYFPESTQLTLVAVTRNKSCGESSKKLNICVKVPEPSNQFALIGLLGLSSVLLLRRIMK